MLIDDSSFILRGMETAPVFSELTPEEKTIVSKHGVIFQYAENTTVFSADIQGDGFYLVISGNLLVRLKNKKVKVCHAGDVFGEIAIFDNYTRTGSIQVCEAAILAKFDKKCIFDETLLPDNVRVKLIKGLTQQIISYLYHDLPISSSVLIMTGESETIEFKASAHKDHFPKIIETIAAMINAHGGTILLGVKDNGELLGARHNENQRDELIRNLNTRIIEKLGEYPSTLVSIDAEIVRLPPKTGQLNKQ
jgi:CRP-like cAMP-binding protein